MAEQKNIQDPLNVDEALMTSETFLLKYKNVLIGIIVGIIVVVCAVFAYKHFISAPRELKAQEALFKGQQYFSNNDFETALNGDSAGYAGFLKIADEYGSTDAGNLANAYAGICYAHLGKFQEAAKSLDNFKASDFMVAPALLGTLGNCYAEMGQYDKAAATLLKAADKANSTSLSPKYLLQAGQILEKQGKNTEAVDAYKQIKNKYANSMEAMDIDKYIDRASIK